MPRHILFVQGAGDGAHDQWDDKLVASLRRELDPDDTILYPRMPDEGDPQYATWKSALWKDLKRLSDGAVLVGHSVGATILLHLLVEQPPDFRPAALILIAPPFIGDQGWPANSASPPASLPHPFPLDIPISLFHGSDDQTVPPAHAHLYAKAIQGLDLYLLPHRDHQLNNDLREVADKIRELAI